MASTTELLGDVLRQSPSRLHRLMALVSSPVASSFGPGRGALVLVLVLAIIVVAVVLVTRRPKERFSTPPPASPAPAPAPETPGPVLVPQSGPLRCAATGAFYDYGLKKCCNWACPPNASFQSETSTWKLKESRCCASFDASGACAGPAYFKVKQCDDGVSYKSWNNEPCASPEECGGERAPEVPKKKWDTFVMTWYSFQDNTPCNSSQSASGRKLIPFVSVALPFRFITSHQINFGDQLYVAYLDGKAMPNGSRHTGWVQVDDFCGDGGKDDYCFQKVKGKKYPNVDLYIGDFTKINVPSCDKGPMGSGQEVTDVFFGPAPAGRFVTDYGGAEKGTAPCGDCKAAKKEQRCWDYTPPASSAKMCKK